MASSALDVCGNINGFSMKRACFVAGTQVVVGEQITQSGELESENVEVADDRNGVYLVVAATAAAAVAFKVLEKKTSKKRVMIELNNIPENVEENAERESSRQNAAENKNLKRGRANSEPEKSRLASWFGGVSLFFLIVSLGTLLGSFVSNNADFKTSESVLASNVASDVSNAEQQTTKYVTKNIEDIQEGDEVLAYDVRSGEPVKSKVSATFHLKSDHLRYLTVLDANGSEQTFQTTDTHPFWVNSDRPDLFRKARDSVSEYDVSTNSDVVFEHDYLLVTESGCYIEAQDLNVGDRFIEPNGETSVLLKTWRETHPEGVDVYNFKVADNSNYFVIANYDDFQNGLEPVLVHNGNRCGFNDRPPNLSPANAGRRGAFRQAKRDLNIPVSEQPVAVIKEPYRGFSPLYARRYVFKGDKEILDHYKGHIFPNPTQNRGPHFNGANGGHYDY